MIFWNRIKWFDKYVWKCVEHGDDEEAVFRTVGVIAGTGLGAVSKYTDELAELGDDTFG